jgi:RNA polymerase sigma-70 factor, ECF subfamily
MMLQTLSTNRSPGIKAEQTGLQSSAVSRPDSSSQFEELAMPLFDSLYNYARWLAQNREEAEDLVQEAYMKALKGFGSFQAGSNFRAWIFRILHNTFLTSRTGLAYRKTLPFDEGEESPPGAVTKQTPESILLSRLDQEALQGAIEQLPVQYREVILLCEVEEMKYQEIAETLSIPIGTVMSRLSRARKAIRDTLLASELRL